MHHRYTFIFSLKITRKAEPGAGEQPSSFSLITRPSETEIRNSSSTDTVAGMETCAGRVPLGAGWYFKDNRCVLGGPYDAGTFSKDGSRDSGKRRLEPL